MNSFFHILYIWWCIKKALPNLRSCRWSSMSYYSFEFTFHSMAHFELVVVKSGRSVSKFISLHVDVQVFSIPHFY